MQGGFDITRKIDIDASPELVFKFFTDAALLQRWLCFQAEVDPRPGGGYAFNVTGSHTTRGTFLVVEPGRRLVYTWLFDHVEPPLPTTVEITFSPLGRGTRLRLRHPRLRGSSDARPPRCRLGALPAAAGRRRRRRRTGRGRVAHRLAGADRWYVTVVQCSGEENLGRRIALNAWAP